METSVPLNVSVSVFYVVCITSGPPCCRCTLPLNISPIVTQIISEFHLGPVEHGGIPQWMGNGKHDAGQVFRLPGLESWLMMLVQTVFGYKEKESTIQCPELDLSDSPSIQWRNLLSHRAHPTTAGCLNTMKFTEPSLTSTSLLLTATPLLPRILRSPGLSQPSGTARS